MKTCGRGLIKRRNFVEMREIMIYVILALIVVACVVVLTYVAHEKSGEENCEEQNCSGDCLHCNHR